MTAVIVDAIARTMIGCFLASIAIILATDDDRADY